ncbi:hypothetical protein LCGC14_0727640, partial [marine sediment metagenome]
YDVFYFRYHFFIFHATHKNSAFNLTLVIKLSIRAKHQKRSLFFELNKQILYHVILKNLYLHPHHLYKICQTHKKKNISLQ